MPLRRLLIALGLFMVQLLTVSVGRSDDGPAFYRCPTGQAAATAERLRTEFGAISGVRIAADERTSQVIVLAPANIQATIRQRLAAGGPVSAAPAAPAATPRPVEMPPAHVGAEQSRSVALRNIKPDQLEASLWNMLGNRFSSLPASRTQTKRYRLALAGGGSIDIAIDAATAQVTVEGPAAAVEACAE